MREMLRPDRLTPGVSPSQGEGVLMTTSFRFPTQMHSPLRIGNFDSLFLEPGKNAMPQLMLHEVLIYKFPYLTNERKI